MAKDVALLARKLLFKNIDQMNTQSAHGHDFWKHLTTLDFRNLKTLFELLKENDQEVSEEASPSNTISSADAKLKVEKEIRNVSVI